MNKGQKLFNVTELAEKIGVTRQTVHFWIRKGWVRPKRDYKNYPVFTPSDVKHVISWKNSLRKNRRVK